MGAEGRKAGHREKLNCDLVTAKASADHGELCLSDGPGAKDPQQGSPTTCYRAHCFPLAFLLIQFLSSGPYISAKDVRF